MENEALRKLVDMSRYLGDPGRTYVILGEGNTSARIDEDSFHIKASGTTLAGIGPEGFVTVSISRVTALIDDPSADDEAVTRVLKSALIDPNESRRPSVEVMLHALMYRYPEYRFVGHTHPVWTNMILCSNRAEEVSLERICPDQIVVCGHKSVYVPYVDPGLVLAREVKRRVDRFVDEEGVLPRSIMMQNHGLIALGDSTKAVTGITDMAEKIAQTIVGTFALGGPRYMKPADVDRIYTRPDEKYRERIIAK